MAAYDIDERKLASALPPPVSSAADDIKWSSAFFGVIVMWTALFGFIVWSLLRALF